MKYIQREGVWCWRISVSSLVTCSLVQQSNRELGKKISTCCLGLVSAIKILSSAV